MYSIQIWISININLSIWWQSSRKTNASLRPIFSLRDAPAVLSHGINTCLIYLQPSVQYIQMTRVSRSRCRLRKCRDTSRHDYLLLFICKFLPLPMRIPFPTQSRYALSCCHFSSIVGFEWYIFGFKNVVLCWRCVREWVKNGRMESFNFTIGWP